MRSANKLNNKKVKAEIDCLLEIVREDFEWCSRSSLSSSDENLRRTSFPQASAAGSKGGDKLVGSRQ